MPTGSEALSKRHIIAVVERLKAIDRAPTPAVSIDTWELSRRRVPATEIVPAHTPADAVERALELVARAR